jgi:hypothetical protein
MPLPQIDLAPITRHLRAKAGSHLLVAAVLHLNVFELLAKQPLSIEELQEKLCLKERPAMVLFPALCAMGFLKFNPAGNLELTKIAYHLTAACSPNLLGYVGLEKEDEGVLRMKRWLLNDGPEESSEGLSYVKDDTSPSPMDEPNAARFFTMALAGRARYLSPLVANKMSRRAGHLLDVASGTGYYTYEWLLLNPNSTATLFDRPEVLKVAAELLEDFCMDERVSAEDIKRRITFQEGDMFTDELPKADLLLAASLFHDWPADTCLLLAKKFSDAIKTGGEIWIHDAFLDDTLDGPLAVTDYSAMLFLGTKGRAYSRKEYSKWLVEAGLVPTSDNIPTLMDYGLICARKPME